MSAKTEPCAVYVACWDDARTVCEHCGTMLSDVFAEIARHDKDGVYTVSRGTCEKCDKTMWSKKLR